MEKQRAGPDREGEESRGRRGWTEARWIRPFWPGNSEGSDGSDGGSEERGREGSTARGEGLRHCVLPFMLSRRRVLPSPRRSKIQVPFTTLRLSPLGSSYSRYFVLWEIYWALGLGVHRRRRLTWL